MGTRSSRASGAEAVAGGAGAVRAGQALLAGGCGLRALLLFDLLWDEKLEPNAAARVARRSWRRAHWFFRSSPF